MIHAHRVDRVQGIIVRIVRDFPVSTIRKSVAAVVTICLLYTSDAADERSSVDLGGRRIIKKKKQRDTTGLTYSQTQTHAHRTPPTGTIKDNITTHDTASQKRSIR